MTKSVRQNEPENWGYGLISHLSHLKKAATDATLGGLTMVFQQGEKAILGWNNRRDTRVEQNNIDRFKVPLFFGGLTAIVARVIYSAMHGSFELNAGESPDHTDRLKRLYRENYAILVRHYAEYIVHQMGGKALEITNENVVPSIQEIKRTDAENEAANEARAFYRITFTPRLRSGVSIDKPSSLWVSVTLPFEEKIINIGLNGAHGQAPHIFCQYELAQAASKSAEDFIKYMQDAVRETLAFAHEALKETLPPSLLVEDIQQPIWPAKFSNRTPT